MRVLSRKVLTTHSKEEIFQILRNSASRYHSAEFEDVCFHIHFPIRWHKQLGFIPVSGTIKVHNTVTEVYVEAHGGFSLYVGMLFAFIAVLIAVFGLFTKTPNIYSSLICMGVGIVVYIVDLFDAITCLDSLEHRLTRGQ